MAVMKYIGAQHENEVMAYTIVFLVRNIVSLVHKSENIEEKRSDKLSK